MMLCAALPSSALCPAGIAGTPDDQQLRVAFGPLARRPSPGTSSTPVPQLAGHRGERGTARPETIDVVSGPLPDLYLESKIVDAPTRSVVGSSVKIISAQAARVNPAIIAPTLG